MNCIVLFTSSLLIGGCNGVMVKSSNVENIKGGSYFSTKASVGDCIYAASYNPLTQFSTEAGFLAPVAEAVVSSLITRGIGKFGEALKKAGDEKIVSVIVTANFEAGPNNVPECIQIVRGTFAREPSSATYPEKISPKLEGAFKKAGLDLVGEPDFFFEGRFKRSVDGQALAIQTSRLDYHRLLDRRISSKSEKRGMVLNFSFLPPGEDAESKKATNVTLSLGNIGDGDGYGGSTYRGVERLHYAETPWFVAPFSVAAKTIPTSITTNRTNAPRVSSGAVTTPATPNANNLGSASPGTGNSVLAPSVATPHPAPNNTNKSLIDPEKYKPMSIQTTIAETRDANKFLQFLGGVFEDSKDELETALKRIALESEREKYYEQKRASEITVASQQLGLLNTYHDSVGTAEKALIAYCGNTEDSPTSRIDKSMAARKAQLAANQSALTAGVSLPYTVSQLAPISKDEQLESVCPGYAET